MYASSDVNIVFMMNVLRAIFTQKNSSKNILGTQIFFWVRTFSMNILQEHHHQNITNGIADDPPYKTLRKFKGFKLAHLNIASIPKRLDELKAFMKDKPVDIIKP